MVAEGLGKSVTEPVVDEPGENDNCMYVQDLGKMKNKLNDNKHVIITFVSYSLNRIIIVI